MIEWVQEVMGLGVSDAESERELLALAWGKIQEQQRAIIEERAAVPLCEDSNGSTSEMTCAWSLLTVLVGAAWVAVSFAGESERNHQHGTSFAIYALATVMLGIGMHNQRVVAAMAVGCGCWSWHHALNCLSLSQNAAELVKESRIAAIKRAAKGNEPGVLSLLRLAVLHKLRFLASGCGIEEMRSQVALLTEEVRRLEENLASLRADADTNSALHTVEIEAAAERHAIVVADLNNTIDQRNVEVHKLQKQLNMQQTEIEHAASRTALQTKHLLAQTKLLQKTAAELELERQAHAATRISASELLQKTTRQATIVEELQKCIHGHQSARTQLHATILDLRGKIRVVCRIRPMISPGDGVVVLRTSGLDGLQVRCSATADKAAKHFDFRFDRVFGPEAQQSEVFVEVQELVQSVVSKGGNRACIFCYGQRGSGKTFSMHGQDGIPGVFTTVDDSARNSHGILARSVEQVFTSVSELGTAAAGWKFSVTISYFDIYNEAVYDLFQVDAEKEGVSPCTGITRSMRNGSPTKVQRVKLSDIEIVDGHTQVRGLRSLVVESPAQVYALLNQVAAHRQRDSSNLSAQLTLEEQISQSHCIFHLRVCGSSQSTGQRVNGVLNLVDLASSDRMGSGQVHMPTCNPPTASC